MGTFCSSFVVVHFELRSLGPPSSSYTLGFGGIPEMQKGLFGVSPEVGRMFLECSRNVPRMF